MSNQNESIDAVLNEMRDALGNVGRTLADRIESAVARKLQEIAVCVSKLEEHDLVCDTELSRKLDAMLRSTNVACEMVDEIGMLRDENKRLRAAMSLILPALSNATTVVRAWVGAKDGGDNA